MWKNLGSTIQTIGNAVAPPVDSDEDSYYEEDDDGSEHEEDPADWNSDDQQQSFGFVGMLTRAMDTVEQKEQENNRGGSGINDTHIAKDMFNDDDDSVDEEVLHRSAAGLTLPVIFSPRKRESGSFRAFDTNTSGELQAFIHDLQDNTNTAVRSKQQQQHPLLQDAQQQQVSAAAKLLAKQQRLENNNGTLTRAGTVEQARKCEKDQASEKATVNDASTEFSKLVQPSDNQSSTTSIKSLNCAPVKTPPNTPPLDNTTSVHNSHGDLLIQTPAHIPLLKATTNQHSLPLPPPPVIKQSLPLPHTPGNKLSLPLPQSPGNKLSLPLPPTVQAQSTTMASQPLTNANQNGISHVSSRKEEAEDEQSQQSRRYQELEQQLHRSNYLIQQLQLEKVDSASAPQQQSSSQLQAQQQQHEKDMQEMEQRLQATRDAADQQQRMLQEKLAHAHESLQLAQQQPQHNNNSEWRKQQEQLARTMALLDEREEQVRRLKDMNGELQSSMRQHEQGVREAHEEMDVLHNENESLRRFANQAETQCAAFQQKMEELQHDWDQLHKVKMELRMVKEERDRERAKSHHAVASASDNNTQLGEQRDEAMAEVDDLKRQLAAAMADLDVAKSDTERVMMANINLQGALESFQSEREAELGMLEEQRLQAEEATAAAYAAQLDATKQAHATELGQLQQATDASIRHSLDGIHQLEARVEHFRLENVQMRRSLDEAIQRLQMNQEDVIDRTLMKNILMDWLTKPDQKSKREVLEVMASVLHFSDEEKEKVHIHGSFEKFGKVVGSLTAAPPASKADLENLQGDNVREKWVNFLLAETDDD